MDALSFPPAAPPVQAQPSGLDTPVGQHDFSIHGVLGIRMINPAPVDAATIARQLGVRPGRAYAEPDIVLKFVERLPTRGSCYVGSKGPGVDRDGRLVVRRGAHRAAIDLGGIGGTCEILCESGIGSVPLLESIADVTILGKGYATLHASAFVHRDRTIVATAWAHGGKTTALLAFTEHGADYLSDDRVWIRGDGEEVYGFSTDLTPKEWQLGQLSSLAAERTVARRLGLYLLRRIEATCARRAPVLPARVLGKAVNHARRRLLPPAQPERLFDRTVTGPAERPHAVFVMLRHEGPEIVVEPLSGRCLVTCAAVSVQHDQRELFEQYRALRFGAPTRPNRCLQSAARLHREILTSALRGTRAYIVRHPPTVCLAELYRAMEPFS